MQPLKEMSRNHKSSTPSSFFRICTSHRRSRFSSSLSSFTPRRHLPWPHSISANCHSLCSREKWSGSGHICGRLAFITSFFICWLLDLFSLSNSIASWQCFLEADRSDDDAIAICCALFIVISPDDDRQDGRALLKRWLLSIQCSMMDKIYAVIL